MTQEEKELILKDLCTRLPYGVIVRYKSVEGEGDIKLGYGNIIYVSELLRGWVMKECKPYLRPMSTMTEEEKKIVRSYGFELIPYDTGHTGFANIENCIDEVSFRFMEEFLNAHYFDCRGLIPMGLALEAKEGMYTTE